MPKPRPVAPPPPRGLDRRERATWRAFAPILTRLGLLTELDAPAFMCLCAVIVRCERARHRLRTLERRLRQATSLEQLALLRKCEVSVEQAEHSFRQFAAEFGLTPAARSRLDVYAPPPSGDDTFEQEFFGGQGS